jgi:hypothetical protein
LSARTQKPPRFQTPGDLVVGQRRDITFNLLRRTVDLIDLNERSDLREQVSFSTMLHEVAGPGSPIRV